MTATPQDARRVGMLVPSSNTVLEPYTFAMFSAFGDAASVHFNRFRVVEISESDASRGQFRLDTILEAADRLAETNPHCIAWCGTAASWLGLETDREMCRAIETRTGIPATSAMLAFEAWFRHRQVRRLDDELQDLAPTAGDQEHRPGIVTTIALVNRAAHRRRAC